MWTQLKIDYEGKDLSKNLIVNLILYCPILHLEKNY